MFQVWPALGIISATPFQFRGTRPGERWEELPVMQEASSHHDTADVHVKSLVTGEKTTFPMPLEATLAQTWEEAYRKLEEARRDGDTLQCAGAAEGQSLMSDLSLTLGQARDQRVCGDAALRYEIKGASGGAAGG